MLPRDSAAKGAMDEVIAADTKEKVKAFEDEKPSINGAEVNSYSYWVDHNEFIPTKWKSGEIDSSIGSFDILAHIDINLFPTQLPFNPSPSTMFQDTDPLRRKSQGSIGWGASLSMPLQGGGFKPDIRNWRLELGVVNGN